MWHFRLRFCSLALLLMFLLIIDVNASSCDYYTQRVQCGDLACSKVTKECIKCTTNSDCYPEAMECNRANGKCKVHSVLKNFDVLTAFAFIFAFIVCAVGVIAGVGGGGILVPMFTPMLHFPMVSAVALSQSTICGQATLNVFLSMRQKHPDLTWDRPLINYQYLSILLPLGLIGTLIGGILNNICPDFIRLLLLFILLTAVLVRTIKRTRKQFSKDKKHTEPTEILNDDNHNNNNNIESVNINKNKNKNNNTNDDEMKSNDEANNHNVNNINFTNSSNNNDDNNDDNNDMNNIAAQKEINAHKRSEDVIDDNKKDAIETNSTIKNDKMQYDSCRFDEMTVASTTEYYHRPPLPQYPKFEITIYLICFFVLLIFNIIRSKVRCGGWAYWICVVIPLVTLGSAFGYCYYRLGMMHEKHPTMLTFIWNFKNSVLYPSVAIIAGAAASMLGIGGGLVLGFVMYEVGLPPEETSMTSGSATFFLAFSSALELLAAGNLQIDYGIIGFIMGIASTALGQLVIMRQIRRRGWLFLIVGALALIVGGSLAILGGYGIYDAVHTTQKGGSIFALGRLCQLEDEEEDDI